MKCLFYFFFNLVIANTLDLKEERVFVPNQFGYPIPVNVSEVLASSQPYFDVNNDVRFDLYTMKNKDEPQILVLNDIDSIKSSNFNRTLPTRIYVHGWQEHGSVIRKTFNDGELIRRLN